MRPTMAPSFGNVWNALTIPVMPPDPEPDDKLPPDEAERRFNQLVGKLVNTPHKPHRPKDAGEATKDGEPSA